MLPGHAANKWKNKIPIQAYTDLGNKQDALLYLYIQWKQGQCKINANIFIFTQRNSQIHGNCVFHKYFRNFMLQIDIWIFQDINSEEHWNVQSSSQFQPHWHHLSCKLYRVVLFNEQGKHHHNTFFGFWILPSFYSAQN